MIAQSIHMAVENNDSITLIDEEFDVVSPELPPGHEWAALACDESWDDYFNTAYKP
jgi:hypothetical protein